MANARTKELLEMAGLGSVADIAESSSMRECLQWFTSEKQWIDQKHLELCRIPAPTFQEQARAEWMATQFRELGCSAEIDRAGNVIAGHGQDHGGQGVALTAHLDTVLAPRRPEDISLGNGGRFLGPGVADNGSGLAALLAMAGALQASPLLENWQEPLFLIASVGEEGEGNLNGMRYIFSQSSLSRHIKASVVLDGPSTGHITYGAIASRRFEITITGPGGHSWTDFGNPNPVHALSKVIVLFSENRLDGPCARCMDTGGNPADPRTSYNFGSIEGGTSVNSIPAAAQAKVDLRSENPQYLEGMTDLLRTSVERALVTENDRSTGAKLMAKVREIGTRPSGRLDDDSPMLIFIHAVDEYLGIRSQQNCASTDANIPLSLGRQAVSIGAGGQGGGAHTPSEWYDPQGREIGLKRILLYLSLLMSYPREALTVAGD